MSGQVSVAQDHEIRAEIAAESEGTALMIPVTVAANTEELKGTQVRGRIATRHALGLGFLDGPLELKPSGTWNVAADIGGTLAEPSTKARVDSAECEVRAFGLLDLTLSDLQAQVYVDGEAVVWKAARCRAYGGHAETEGVLSTTDAFSGMDASLTCNDVEVGELVLPGVQISELLTGALTASAQFRKLSSGAISGSSTVLLEAPTYPAIEHARAQLEDVSLPVPSPRGVGPLRCRVGFEDELVTISELEAGVDGITLHGGGKVMYTGALDGGASARLSSAYLKRSPLFVIPATLAGGLAVPIHVGGHLQRPRITTNVGKALRDKLGMREITGAVTSALDGLRDAFATATRTSAEPDDTELEALVDRCMEGGPNTDELIDRLIDAGVTSDQIVRILEKRRMRF